MAMQRAETQNIVTTMSALPQSSTEWDIRCAYRDKGVADIGSHYLIEANGDLITGRDKFEHGNVSPLYNKNSVFIEFLGTNESEITEAQRATHNGLVERLLSIFIEAEPLEILI